MSETEANTRGDASNVLSSPPHLEVNDPSNTAVVQSKNSNSRLSDDSSSDTSDSSSDPSSEQSSSSYILDIVGDESPRKRAKTSAPATTSSVESDDEDVNRLLNARLVHSDGADRPTVPSFREIVKEANLQYQIPSSTFFASTSASKRR